MDVLKLNLLRMHMLLANSSRRRPAVICVTTERA